MEGEYNSSDLWDYSKDRFSKMEAQVTDKSREQVWNFQDFGSSNS